MQLVVVALLSSDAFARGRAIDELEMRHFDLSDASTSQMNHPIQQLYDSVAKSQRRAPLE